LLCAATVNVRFREVLLRDPAKAIATGYFDHSFTLTAEERDLVCGIQAQGLEDFAAQVYHWICGPDSGNGYNGSSRNGNGHNGNGHNGNGHKQERLMPADTLVDLYRAPAMACA
jgi:hypothetical protein